MKTKTHTREEVYIWYDPEQDQCVTGTMYQFRQASEVSYRKEDFNIICCVANDEATMESLVQPFRKA
ncbi:MAG: hypothetical protein AAFO69_13260 [Bacteroidota bacterium]